MKKLVKLMTVAWIAAGITVAAFHYTFSSMTTESNDVELSNFYPVTAMVTQVEDNLITVACQNGNIFKFDNTREDWFVGDICSMIMNNNGTENVKDDIVVDTRYSGYVLDEDMNKWIK